MLSTSKFVGRNVYFQTRSFSNALKTTSQKSFLTTTTNNDTIAPKKVTFRDKYDEVRNGPTFKYWVIGTTAFISWMTYYGLKSYKKTRITVEIPPSSSSHIIIHRSKEIEEIITKHAKQTVLFNNQNVKKLLIQGPPGIGKTTLVYDFAKQLQNKQDGMRYSLPKSNILAFIQCESEDSFLQSLKSIAAKLQIKLSDLEEQLDASDISFNVSSFPVQCNALLGCIQETVKKHPGWIFVFDHVQSTSPESVGNVIGEWFLKETSLKWNKGTIVIVYEGIIKNDWNLKEETKYTVKHGITNMDACSLIKNTANLESAVANSVIIKNLVEKVHLNPLAIVCVGLLLKDKLQSKEIVSIEKAVTEIVRDIDESVEGVLKDNNHLSDFVASPSGFNLLVLETVIAMVMNSYLNANLYLQHGFDMLSTLKPNTAVPHSLIVRHLSSKFYRLPPLKRSDQNRFSEFFNKQKSDLDAIKSKADEFEPKGKAWSNRNLAEYVRKIEEYFSTAFTTVKEIYNLVYGVLPSLPEKEDGFDMFRSNEMLTVGKVQPGESKSVTLHPLVYNAVRQHYLANTVYKFEENHLHNSKVCYENQPWYKRFSGFSEQACLHKYRTSCGHSKPKLGILEYVQPETYLFRYNLGINVSSVYKKNSSCFDKLGEFWLPKGEDKLRYLQDHITRVLTSVCDEIQVTKDDVNGRTVKKLLLSHLEYILYNQPREVIGDSMYIEGLQTVASCYSELYKDFDKSKQLYENILDLQKSFVTANPLDIGKTMTKIAELHNAYGNYDQARILLEEAAELYEVDRRKNGEYKRSLEFGKLMGLLGVVYASLNRKIESKEAIERSLMLKQAMPPDLSDEAKSKQFGSEFASSLTDLGHSYVSLGLPLYGKKILDFALSAHKNLHGDNHPEVIRTLTVLAVAHLMQGNNEESKKLRREAGKLQSALNVMPIY